jgi:predicted Zn-dependent protease
MARSSGMDAMSVLTLLSMALLARNAGAAQAAGMLGQAVSATRQAAYSRGLELESDTLGTRYMAAAGYDPKGAVGFLKILDQERTLNPVDIPAYVLSHPITQERIANAELVVKSLGPTQPRPDDPVALKKVQLILRRERSAQDNLVGEYEKLTQQSPHNADLLHLLGYAQQLSGNLAAAQQNYERARQLRPDYAPLHRDLGQLFTQLNDFTAARAAFDRAVALEPSEPLTFLFLGEMLEKAGDLRSAAGAYLNAQNLAPLWDRPPHRLGLVYGKLDRLGDGYYYLARSAVLQDEDERAIADYERALKFAGAHTPRGQAISEELKTLKSRKR